MAVLTFGDILQQCKDITGIDDTEATAIRALKAGINTAHTKVVLAAVADGASWTLKTARLAITVTTTSVILPDGSTVTDTAGAIPAACRSVRAVRLVGQRVPLTRMAKDVWERENGILEAVGRGTPQFFDPYGYDSSGRGLLWIMPYPNAADVLSIDYIACAVPLTYDAQPLVPPADFRELVCQEAIACVNSRSTIDPGIIAGARTTADFLWRCVNGASEQYSPVASSPHQSEE